MNFGQALECLKNGDPITRTGWSGANLFVYLVPAAAYPAQTGVAKSYWGTNLVPYEAYFAIKNSRGTVNTWVPSVSDCLADDWLLVRT